MANLEKIRTQTRVAAEVISSYETRQAAFRQIEEARGGLVEALDSLKLNFVNIRQGAELPRATRPIEVLQPIQALAQTRSTTLTRSSSTTAPNSVSSARSASSRERIRIHGPWSSA